MFSCARFGARLDISIDDYHWLVVCNPCLRLVGLAAGWLFERLIRGAAYQQRDQILSQAQTDAETLRKSQDLAAKEDLLKRRESLERELGAVRDELREQERRLDRRDTMLTEQQQDMSKKERMVEITQKKLAEKLEQSDARDTELQQTPPPAAGPALPHLGNDSRSGP